MVKNLIIIRFFYNYKAYFVFLSEFVFTILYKLWSCFLMLTLTLIAFCSHEGDIQYLYLISFLCGKGKFCFDLEVNAFWMNLFKREKVLEEIRF